MSHKGALLETITLTGMEIAPSQVCGAIRLVPLLRRSTPGDLRLSRHAYKDDVTIAYNSKYAYISYVPHALVLDWNTDGSAVVASGTQLRASDGTRVRWGSASIRYMHRTAKREAGNSLRLLPLHLALEGFLSLYFAGPDIAWEEYSRRAIRKGLSPRTESFVPGDNLAAFENALRTFEIHEGQVGVLMFVADALASAFVTPSPQDYHALHRTLLADFYGELIYQYAVQYNTVSDLRVTIDEGAISDLNDLRAAVARVRADWASFQGLMAENLLGVAIASQRVYQAGPFSLQRFVTNLDPTGENHIGEVITRDDGTLEYLKTFRLSANQTRRAYLLSQLAAAEWNIDAAASNLQTTQPELIYRLEKAGLDYIIMQHVRDAAAKHRRSLRRDGGR